MQLSSFAMYGMYIWAASFVALLLTILYFKRKAISLHIKDSPFLTASFKTDYRDILSNKKYLISMGTSYLFFISSLFASYLAVQIAHRDAGNSTTDILLDHLPVVNTDIIFTEGAMLFVFLIAVLLFLKPKTFTFTMKALALLIYTRSLFVIMTHLGPYPTRIVTEFDNFRYVSTGSDLFFSGHTAVPFMMALLFWQVTSMRYMYILCSVTAAAAVLLGHLHYTIDVFAAYFITYGVYQFAKFSFEKDYHFFAQNVEQ
jgi:PAP2 superfamily C-terminal